jgi:hypothetical protein
VDLLFRFYQGEWLIAQLPAEQWKGFFQHGRTAVSNPGTALLIESKRFPLVWDDLDVPLPTWRAFLPETFDPRAARWRGERGWVLKTAFCNTGDAVAIPGVGPATRWRQAVVDAAWRPWRWVVQRRFEPLAIATPRGPMYPCLGVYVIDGRAAGVYGRIAPRPLIDFEAIDIAVLLRGATEERPGNG